MKKFEQIFKIDYSDIQESQQLSNKGFLKYLQQSASLHSDKLGYGLEKLSLINLGWVITNWKLEVKRRPKYGEEVIVKTWCRKADKVCFLRDFEVYDEKKKCIAVATSQWIWMDLTKKTIHKIEEETLKKYKVTEREVLPDFRFKRIKEPEQFENEFNYKIQRRDIDTNHHVNNLNYLDFAYETLPEDAYRNIDFTDIEIAYKKEIMPKEEIKCLYSKNDEKKYVVVIKSKRTEEVKAIIKLENNKKNK